MSLTSSPAGRVTAAGVIGWRFVNRWAAFEFLGLLGGDLGRGLRNGGDVHWNLGCSPTPGLLHDLFGIGVGGGRRCYPTTGNHPNRLAGFPALAVIVVGSAHPRRHQIIW